MNNTITAQLHTKLHIVFVQCIVGNQFVLLLVDGEQCFFQSITFKASAADGAGDFSVVFHQHAGARSAVGRAFHMHNRCQGHLPAAGLRFFERGEDIAYFFRHGITNNVKSRPC